MNQKKVSLVVGSFAGLVHLVWSIAIAFGFAQPWIDFIYKMHSLNNPFVVAPFNLGRSAGLVLVTFLVGYVVGYIFSTIWNKINK
ncbi:MAG: hypothetical protein V4699_00575 [Patescibacteria group bacterium]